MDAIVTDFNKSRDSARDDDFARPNREEVEAAIRTLIAWIGDDPNREGLRETPGRVIRSFEQLFSGYDVDVEDILCQRFTDIGGYEDLVLVRDIRFHSNCEHHMLPVLGTAHIAYYPSPGVVGLSKLARLVEAYARRLQTQETMTRQICQMLDKHLNPRGVAVYIDAEHLCMTMRGVQKEGARTVTMDYSGIFKEDPEERTRFLKLIRREL